MLGACTWGFEEVACYFVTQGNKIATTCTETVSFESPSLRRLELARDTMFRAGFVINSIIMDVQVFVSLLAGLGIGSIATAIISGWLDKKKQMDLTLARILEDKYRGLLVFMACALNIEKKRYFTINEQVEQKTAQEYMNQVVEYYYHSTLYSSDQVILTLKEFIENPNEETYIKVAQAMRKDLWGRKTNIDFSDIKLDK